MSAPSPTARTLEHLRSTGYECQVVERWCPYSKRRIDLFGIIDIVAVRPGEVLGIQCTTMSNTPARIHKALAEPRLKAWLESGAIFEVWGWSLKGARGERKTWQLTRRPITMDMITDTEFTPPSSS